MRREAREVEQRGGFVEVNRPMRSAPRFEPPERRLSPPPEEPSRNSRMGLLSSLPFALMGVVLWLVTGSALMLLFVAVSPLMVVLFYVEDRWGGKRTYARLARGYRQQLAELKEELDAVRDAEVRHRRAAAPSPAELAARTRGRHETLWERRLEDDDFLALRVGSADSPALGRWELDPGGSADLRDEAAELLGAYATVPAVPVCIPLAECGTLGVSGRPDRVPRRSRAASSCRRRRSTARATSSSPRRSTRTARAPGPGRSGCRMLPATQSRSQPRSVRAPSRLGA